MKSVRPDNKENDKYLISPREAGSARDMPFKSEIVKDYDRKGTYFPM